ncbi:SRPBCC family protein [Salinifilum ghardaiensis]
MARSYASATVDAPADAVWRVVRDFDGLPQWHPAIATSRIEDGRPADAVGCVRHLTMPDGSVVRERLVDLDDVARSYTYEIVEGPFPVRKYRATLHVAPVTVDDASFVEWYADFDAEAADEEELDGTFSRDVFAAGLQALRAHFER